MCKFFCLMVVLFNCNTYAGMYYLFSFAVGTKYRKIGLKMYSIGPNGGHLYLK